MFKKDNNLINQYTIRSKDVPLISFSLYAEEKLIQTVAQKKYYIVINKIFSENKKLFPKQLDNDLSEKKLLKWITSRKAPKNRQFAEKIMMAIEDDNNPLKYADITHALSLNDAYWITNNLITCKWKDFNLYENKFNEILANVAFTGYSQKVSGIITTPEVTSCGALKKCWSNREDGIYLIKGDDFVPRKDNRSQVTNEYYAAQIAKQLNLNFVSYDLEEFKHKNGETEIVCKCKLFTSNDIGYIDAYTYLKSLGYENPEDDLKDLDYQLKIANLFGKKEYEDLMLFDTIIGNRDRHLGNFGMLVDNNTGKILKMAPIFDNGLSMLYGAAPMDLLPENIEDYKNTLECKYLSFNKQAQVFVQKRHIEKLKKLQHFHFKRHPHYNIAEPTLKLMEEFIHERATRAVELYYEKERQLKNIKSRKPSQMLEQVKKSNKDNSLQL